jgi:transcriptional regulator with XRE-family HTH domain
MRLQEYRLQNDLTLQKLADLLGVEGLNPRQTVNRYCLGIRRPIPVILEKIEDITNGQVKGIDFDEHYQQVHKKR